MNAWSYKLYASVQIKELEKAFSYDLNLIEVVRNCLQVNSARRPSAGNMIKKLDAK